ncbi:MAG TPA: AIR synthase-related protein, partial [Longimicrobiaceae bacterium]
AFADPSRSFGVRVELRDVLPVSALLFGEAQSRVVLSCAPESTAALLALMAEHGVPAERIGAVGPEGGAFRVATAHSVVEAPIGELAAIYYGAIPRRMDGTPEDVETSLESEVQHG